VIDFIVSIDMNFSIGGRQVSAYCSGEM
jgi:hypothetical protein